MNIQRKYIILIVTAVSVILTDQLSKWYITVSLSLHETIPVIEGFFSITSIRNPGAAFGFLSGMPPFFRAVFFLGLSAGAIVVIFLFIRFHTKKNDVLVCALSLIFGGAVGNMIDRIRLGEVIDFIDLSAGPYHWPAFNIADSVITVGAVILLWDMIRKER